MKSIPVLVYIIALFLLTSCEKEGIDDDVSFLNSARVNNPGQLIQMTNDNSGKVTITPTGEGVSSFLVIFGHGSGQEAQAEVNPGHNAVHFYPEGSYTVTILSKSLSGEELASTIPLVVTYRAPENLVVTSDVEAHTLTIGATADFAASYLVYFGETDGEEGVPLANGGQISHTYGKAGNYDVRVVALSGGAATTEETFSVTIVDPFGFPITFENPNVNYFFGTFGDAQQFSTVENPSPTGINPSDKVGKFVRGVQGWSGTYSPLNTPLDMSQGKVIKVMVYNPDEALVGAALNIELEAGSSLANGVAVLKTALTTFGQWEELTFDFGSIEAIPSSETFHQLVLRFNDSMDGQGAVIYVDNFIQSN
ncbi:MAG TPA: hypothetical protein VKZ54_13215 [Membranihabitans sp.]|nr:hypothetical protein [Membranihabitans sp.]